MKRGTTSIRQAILAASSYADVFGYPLTEDELLLWTPFVRGTDGKKIRSSIRRLVTEEILKRNPPFITLTTGSASVPERITRSNAAVKKWALARFAATALSRIPWIRMIGVTGALSMENAGAEDDIDFCIVTDSGSVWTVRMLSTVLVALMGRRRRPDATRIRDRICLNMFLSGDAQSVPVKERDFYTAHEVLQFTPLYERNPDAYRTFLQRNRWVASYLPRAWKKRMDGSIGFPQPARVRTAYLPRVPVPSGIERMLMDWQIRYMRRRLTKEVVTENIIRFHPHDARGWISARFGEKIGKLGIPLTRFFSDPKIAVTS